MNINHGTMDMKESEFLREKTAGVKLDGIWDFVFVPEKSGASIDWDAVNYDDQQMVPGCFDMDERYKFRRGRGIYRTRVECGGFVRLEIGAIGLRAEIRFDHRKIGEIETAYMADILRFDAGPLGKHELVIIADNRFDQTPASNFRDFYDFYGYGGIYRSIVLAPENPFWIDRCSVVTDDFQTGKIKLSLEFSGKIPAELDIKITIDDKIMDEILLAGNSLTKILAVPNFRLWTPDTPFLHKLEIVAEECRETIMFGIRQVEIREGRFYLNGAPVKLLGYNRHDSHPDFGAAIPEADMVRDLRVIKTQGANFIRGCHYPQSEAMLSLCDQLGLLVWNESLGWGDRIESLSNPEFCRKQIDQTRRMVRRSMNHPCIVVWGFMNELHADTEEARALIAALAQTIRAEDNTRPVSYGTWMAEKDQCYEFVDILTFNLYPGWYYYNSGPFFCEQDVIDRIDALLEFGRKNYPDKAIIIGEIGAASLPDEHSGLRWSEEYQADMCITALRKGCEDDRISGVGIWQFCNARTYVVDGAPVRPRGFNNKGVLDEYRRPKYAWFAISRFFRDLGMAKWIDPRLDKRIGH